MVWDDMIWVNMNWPEMTRRDRIWENMMGYDMRKDKEIRRDMKRKELLRKGWEVEKEGQNRRVGLSLSKVWYIHKTIYVF